MGLRATVPTPQIPHTGPRFEIPRPFLDDFDTDHEELPVDHYPPAPQTPEEWPSTPLLSWPADPTEIPVNNEESVDPHGHEPRDERAARKGVMNFIAHAELVQSWRQQYEPGPPRKSWHASKGWPRATARSASMKSASVRINATG